MDDRDIVAAIHAQLATRIGRDRYEVWFSQSQLALRDERLVVVAPTQFHQDWLRSHFRRQLEEAAQAVCERQIAVEFRVASNGAASNAAVSNGALPNGTPSNGTPSNGTLSNGTLSNGSLSSAAPPSSALPDGASSAQKSPSLQSASTPQTAELTSHSQAPQGTIAGEKYQTVPAAPVFVPTLMRRPPATLDTFVVGDANCLAHTAAQLTLEHPGRYCPMFVHGPTSTGKTHLLEGIYSAFRRLHPRAGAIYLSAEQFTSYFCEAVHKRGMPSFRAKYRNLELLVIDDVQFFRDKRATLEELQHTIDTLLRHGKQLVFAADRAPAQLKTLGPELVARLSGGMVCRLEPPDYATRRGIVRHLAQRLGMGVSEEIEVFIAQQFSNQARELDGALKRLQTMSLAHGKRMTLAFAQEALAELLDHAGRAVRLPDIEKAVCDVFGLDPQCLQSKAKSKTVSHPRMLAMWLARKHTRAAYSEIGSYFGRRSHSTVISAEKKVTAWMAGGTAFNIGDGPLSLEESIRRVENHLRIG